MEVALSTGKSIIAQTLQKENMFLPQLFFLQ
jgi:hypothetical protein